MVLAEMLAAQGDFDKAKEQDALAIAKAEQLGGPRCPASTEAKARLARISQQASDFSDLLSLAEGEAKAGKPDQAAMGQFVVGAAYAIYGRPQEAIQAYEKVVADYPGTPRATRAQARLAALYAVSGHPEKAKALRMAVQTAKQEVAAAPAISARVAGLEDMIKTKPDSPEALDAKYRIACLHASLGEYDEAIKQLTEVVHAGADKPIAARAFGMLATVYIQADRQDAATALPQLAAAAPKSIPMMSRLALYYRETGDRTKAEATLAQTAGAQSDQAAADSFRENGEKKIAEMRSLIAAKPKSAEAAEAQYRIGGIYAQYGKTDEAIAEFSNLVKEQPDSAAAGRGFEIMQVLYTREGRSEEAGKVLPKLVEDAAPKSPQMQAQLCRYYRRAHDVKSIEHTCDKLEAESAGNPQVARALLARCWGNAEERNTEGVVSIASQIVAKYPQTREASLALNLAIDRAGWDTQAFMAWADKAGVQAQTMVRALDVPREAYTKPTWKQLAAGITSKLGDAPEAYTDLPVSVRGRVAAFWAASGRDEAAQRLISSIPTSQILSSDRLVLSDMAEALLVGGYAPETALWALKREMGLRGTPEGVGGLFVYGLACRASGDLDTVRQEFIPRAEKALGSPGGDPWWGYALWTLVWGYSCLGDRPKAIEREQYWLKLGRERKESAQGMAEAAFLVAELQAEVGDIGGAASTLRGLLLEYSPESSQGARAWRTLARLARKRSGDASISDCVLLLDPAAEGGVTLGPPQSGRAGEQTIAFYMDEPLDLDVQASSGLVLTSLGGVSPTSGGLYRQRLMLKVSPEAFDKGEFAATVTVLPKAMTGGAGSSRVSLVVPVRWEKKVTPGGS